MVRAVVDAINRREWDHAFAYLTPDFEYDLSRTDSPLRGVYRGLEEVRRVAVEFWEPWTSVRYDIHELIPVGDRIVMPCTTHFEGRQGIAVEGTATWLWTVRDGALTRLALYQELDEAFAAAGVGRLRLWRYRRGRKAERQ
jgi:ketosteroid isomerase-like protein